SYCLEVKNNTSYPLVNVKVKYVGTFTQNLKDVPVASREETIPYLGPAGSPYDTFFWPDAFKSGGTVKKSTLQATMDRRPAGGKLIRGDAVVNTSDRTFFRPYWWWYRPYWYFD